jgi:NAD(P)-dependent dehydrogenase (short-subunit alcohol dehydrogenase family)
MKLNMANAIITGGASGLGLRVARKLLEAGARVAILDNSPEGSKRLAKVLGREVPYFLTDVTSEPAVDQAVKQVADRFGGLTLAVNCAGIVRSQRVVGRDRLLSQADFARVTISPTAMVNEG